MQPAVNCTWACTLPCKTAVCTLSMPTGMHGVEEGTHDSKQNLGRNAKQYCVTYGPTCEAAWDLAHASLLVQVVVAQQGLPGGKMLPV
jgi:hypothetical protein